MDPLTIAAIGSTAIKGVTGLAQYLKGRKLEKQNIRPEYEIPMEIRDKLSTAQLQAYQGLPEEQKQQFLQNMQRSTSGAMQGLSSRRAGLAGIGALAQGETDALTNLLSMDAQQRLQNIQALQGVRSEVAGYKDRQFEMNKLNPFYEKAQAAQGLKGAGLQNIFNAIDTGVDIYGQSQYLKTLKEMGGEATPVVRPKAKMEYMPMRGGLNLNPEEWQRSTMGGEEDINMLPYTKRRIYGRADEETFIG